MRPVLEAAGGKGQGYTPSHQASGKEPASNPRVTLEEWVLQVTKARLTAQERNSKDGTDLKMQLKLEQTLLNS